MAFREDALSLSALSDAFRLLLGCLIRSKCGELCQEVADRVYHFFDTTSQINVGKHWPYLR